MTDVETLHREIAGLKQQREKDRAGILAAINRIDRNHESLRQTVIGLRELVGDLITAFKAVERLTDRLARLEAKIDALIRVDGAVH